MSRSLDLSFLDTPLLRTLALSLSLSLSLSLYLVFALYVLRICAGGETRVSETYDEN